MRENEALGAAFQEEEFADYIGLTYDQIAARLQEVDKGGRRAVCALQAMLDLLKPASWSAQQVLEVAMEHPDFDRSDLEAEVENMDKPEVEQDKTEKEKMEMEESEKKKMEESEKKKMEMEESEKKKMEMEESEKKKMEMEEREKKKMEMKERENEKMEMEEREKKKMELKEREKVEVVIDVEEEELQLPAPYGSIWRRLGDAQAKKRPQPAPEPAKSYWGKWKRALANGWWGADSKRSKGEETEKGWEEKKEKKGWEEDWQGRQQARWGQGSGWEAKQGDGGDGKGKGYRTGNGNGWGAEGGGKGQGNSKGKGKAQRWAPKPPWAHAKRQDRGAHGGQGGRDRWGGRYVPGGYEDGDGVFYPHLAEIHGSMDKFLCYRTICIVN